MTQILITFTISINEKFYFDFLSWISIDETRILYIMKIIRYSLKYHKICIHVIILISHLTYIFFSYIWMTRENVKVMYNKFDASKIMISKRWHSLWHFLHFALNLKNFIQTRTKKSFAWIYSNFYRTFKTF